MHTILEYPALDVPRVLIACRECDGRGCFTEYRKSERHWDPTAGHDVDCRACDGTGQALTDEPMASDEVLDADALTANEAFWESYVPPAPTKRAPWPPRFPTPAEHAEIAGMQTDYLASLRAVRAPEKAA